jgi:hypothetical protein
MNALRITLTFAPGLALSALLLAPALPGWGVPHVQAGLHAQAQGQTQQPGDLPVLAVGETVTGVITPESPRLQGGGGFQAWRFQARRGDRLVADARSSSFDAYLLLARLVGGITEVIREDDDGGEGTDARIRFVAEEDGHYVLMVRSWSDSGTGSFTLSLEDRGPAPPAEVRSLAMGGMVQGEIDPDGATFSTEWGDEIPFHFWTFEGSEGDGVQISLEAPGFDAYLELGTLEGETFVMEAFDDDGGGGTNALLRHLLSHTGTHVIRARPLGPYLQDGGYLLRLEPWVPAGITRRDLEAGAVVSGTFTRNDGLLPEGPYVQEWVYQAREGERVRIRMRSQELDSYLSVGWEDPAGRFVEVAFNDDAPDDGLNSLVELTLDRSGPLIIRARPLGTGVVGSYTLQLERVGPGAEG